jgi:hypothetical protein
MVAFREWVCGPFVSLRSLRDRSPREARILSGDREARILSEERSDETKGEDAVRNRG